MNLKCPSNRFASIPYRGVLQTETFEPVVEYWQSALLNSDMNFGGEPVAKALPAENPIVHS